MKAIRSVAMILCVGPAEKYCSRICCTVALKNALALKQLDPDAQVVIFYRDIRTYGFGERLYTQARETGRPVCALRRRRQSRKLRSAPGDGSLHIQAWEHALKRPLHLQPDLLVLSMPIVPRGDAPKPQLCSRCHWILMASSWKHTSNYAR